MNKPSKLSVILVAMLVLALFASACGAKDNPVATEDTLKGNITISGAWALYPMMTVWAEEYAKIKQILRRFICLQRDGM